MESEAPARAAGTQGMALGQRTNGRYRKKTKNILTKLLNKSKEKKKEIDYRSRKRERQG